MATPQYIKDAQNTYNAKFDLVQLKLPKGTKDRIKAVLEDRESISSYCVQSVLVSVESDEDFKGIGQPQQEPIQTAQKAEISNETEAARENTEEPPKVENKENNKPKNAKTEAEQLAELQAMIENKRAKQKEQEEAVKQAQEQRVAEKKAEEQAEVNKILNRILSGSEPEEDAEKEALRQEIIAKANCPF